MKHLLFFVLICASNLSAQPFLFESFLHDKIPTTVFGDAVMFDQNLDGMADVLLVGKSDGNYDGILLQNGGEETRNDPRTGDYQVQRFFINSTVLPNLIHADAAVGDVDLDGDPDVAVAGAGAIGAIPYQLKLQLYRINGTNVPSLYREINGLHNGDMIIADFNANGSPDLLACGKTWSEAQLFWLKDLSTSIQLGSFDYCDLAAADVDKDGDLDFVVSGQSGSSGKTALYLNDNGNFVVAQGQTNLPQVVHSAVAFGDLTGDGYPDLVVSGGEIGPEIMTGRTTVFKNVNGSFSYYDTISSLEGTFAGNVHIADFDSDGKYDVVLNGGTTGFGTPITYYYRNDGTGALTLTAKLVGVMYGMNAIGDIDNDGDLDMVSGGWSGEFNVTHYYKNKSTRANFQPNPPTNLNQTVSGNQVTLSWNPAQDLESPSALLTYNLQVYRGATLVFSGMANAEGKRYVWTAGNASYSTQWKLNLSSGSYRWRVQTIDPSFKGSVWSEEKTFSVSANSQISTDVATEEIPQSLQIDQNYPNPFISATRFKVQNPAPQSLKVRVFDTLGREVKVLVDGVIEAGTQTLTWDGTNQQAEVVPAGVYFVQLQSETQQQVQKVVKQ